ncbi:MAG TPA: DUF3078 domain-containing protein [Edaphocola sp.]|nr:DUF3078 domain-containing protein [Edaphocola sp.]
MKKRILFFTAMAMSVASFAQLDNVEEVMKQKHGDNSTDTISWSKDAMFTLNGSQSLLHNWAAGGELASLALNGRFDGNANRNYHRHIWTNNLLLLYGMQANYSTGFQAFKTDDRIDFTSKYGYKIKPNGRWYISGLLNARTQFSKGYSSYDIPNWKDFSTSNFLSPLYLMFSPGLEYRKGDEFSFFISPLAVRATFVDRFYTDKNPEGAFGVLKGKNARWEMGAYASLRYKKELAKNLLYVGRVDLYSNYLAKDIKDGTGNIIKKDSPANIDIFWDNMFTYQFFKYFNVGFGLTAIYDNDVPFKGLDANGIPLKEPISGLGWWQISQKFSVGFIYKF